MIEKLNVKQKIVCKIPPKLLNGGVYYLHPCVGIHRKKWIIGGFKDVEGLSFNVHFNVPNDKIVYNDSKPGSLSPILNWELNNV